MKMEKDIIGIYISSYLFERYIEEILKYNVIFFFEIFIMFEEDEYKFE